MDVVDSVLKFVFHVLTSVLGLGPEATALVMLLLACVVWGLPAYIICAYAMNAGVSLNEYLAKVGRTPQPEKVVKTPISDASGTS